VSLIQSSGCSIFLSTPFPLIAKRVNEKADDRPLFRDQTQARELYQQRIHFYRAADFTIDVGDDHTPSQIVERIFISLPREVFDGRATRAGR
jgi:shikimate kinase